jgi:hypothetical protein
VRALSSNPSIAKKEKTNYKQKRWECGSNGTMLAYHVQISGLNPPSTTKEKKKKKEQN